MLVVERLTIEGLVLITPRRFGDTRGFFSEVFNQRSLEDATGFRKTFVQDNHSWSVGVGVIRGLHFQLPPHAQDKLVRVSRGRIVDVAVDVRRGSPTYGRHVAIELSAENWAQLLIPVGFAHGFMTLEADTEVQYKVTDFYDAACDSGIRWNDPNLGIKWPNVGAPVNVSPKDAQLPFLRDFATPFSWP
jgi:dTDP-4-dehydrorhamnose 3,5-epimerase